MLPATLTQRFTSPSLRRDDFLVSRRAQLRGFNRIASARAPSKPVGRRRWTRWNSNGGATSRAAVATRRCPMPCCTNARAGHELPWQFVFPSTVMRRDECGRATRWHADASALDRIVYAAAQRAGIAKRVNRHTFRHRSRVFGGDACALRSNDDTAPMFRWCSDTKFVTQCCSQRVAPCAGGQANCDRPRESPTVD